MYLVRYVVACSLISTICRRNRMSDFSYGRLFVEAMYNAKLHNMVCSCFHSKQIMRGPRDACFVSGHGACCACGCFFTQRCSPMKQFFSMRLSKAELFRRLRAGEVPRSTIRAQKGNHNMGPTLLARTVRGTSVGTTCWSAFRSHYEGRRFGPRGGPELPVWGTTQAGNVSRLRLRMVSGCFFAEIFRGCSSLALVRRGSGDTAFHSHACTLCAGVGSL